MPVVGGPVWLGDVSTRRMGARAAVEVLGRVGSEPAARTYGVVRPKRRKRSELASTDTLDSDMAALAKTGESSQPVDP